MPLTSPHIGLGLAAIGRPGYITLGRTTDLPQDRSIPALEERAFELLDAAYASGVRYVDAARSYGLAETFLARWLDARPDAADVVIGSKWGYTYTADWHVEANVHEVKDHSLAAYRRQLAETRALLGDRLSLYQIHSVTPESPALTDAALHEELARLADSGVTVGFSTSGPHQATVIRAALAVTVGGRRLFGAVQSTYNLLERSAESALAEAHDAGLTVIVKEALANGRLTDAHLTPDLDALREIAHEASTSADAVAIAAVSAQPWADIVLSGAATTDQLTSNLAAGHVTTLDRSRLDRLAALTEPPSAYWSHRSQLAWS